MIQKFKSEQPATQNNFTQWVLLVVGGCSPEMAARFLREKGPKN
jgi:hypothetical protein